MCSINKQEQLKHVVTIKVIRMCLYIGIGTMSFIAFDKLLVLFEDKSSQDWFY